MHILVTGATGFVGRRLCAHLADGGHTVVAAVRNTAAVERVRGGCRPVVVGDLASPVDWSAALTDVECVVHLAARVHVLKETAADAAARYQALNVDATVRLAEAAARANVRRVVFVSSIKAAGEESAVPLREEDVAAPVDPYGASKLAAERALFAMSAAGAIESVIVRPPLVYGPGVGGNFRRLLALAQLARRVPLPLGGLCNARSLVYVDNLADALHRCCIEPAARDELFHVSDGDDLSTSQLVSRLARHLGGPARLFAVPEPVMRLAARAVGRSAEADRLLGSLRVDVTKIRRLLGWTPPTDVDGALAASAHAYRVAHAV